MRRTTARAGSSGVCSNRRLQGDPNGLIAKSLRHLDGTRGVALEHELAIFDEYDVAALNVSRACHHDRITAHDALRGNGRVFHGEKVAAPGIFVADEIRVAN